MHLLLQAIMLFLQGRQIREHELRIDHFDVTDWINRSADVMNVRIFKTANHLHDRVNFANVMKELVSQSFARARAFHQTGDIDELDRGWCDIFESEICAILANRWSGTVTTPTFGSIVQNG